MRLPIRRFAPIAAVTLVIALVAATAFLAMAHDRSHSGPKICATSAADVGGEGPYPGRERRGDEKNDERYGCQRRPATSMRISWQ